MTEAKLERSGSSRTRVKKLANHLLQYAVALLSVALALGVTALLGAYLEPTPTPLFFVAVMVSAWYGGVRPAIAATVLSTLAINYFLLEPLYTLSLPNLGTIVRLGVFVMTALLISSLNEAQRTARRKAEASFKSLRESEARFGCLAESNIIGMLVTDLDGVILEANTNFLQTVGYTPAELQAGDLHWRQMTPPESIESSERAIQELLSTGFCTPFEKEYFRKDGSRVSVLYGAVMSGAATVTGFVLDLSARKQVEAIQQEALRRERSLHAEVQAANTQLETVLASLQDQFFVLDHDWRYLYASDRVVEMVGRPRAEIIGQSIWELFPDIVGSQFYHKVQHAVAEQQIVHFEYFYPRWQRWFENRIYPSQAGVSLLVTDITERKQAEEKLQRTNQTLQTLLDVCPVAIACFEPNGIVRLWNRAAERIYGWSATETLGQFMPTVPHRSQEFLTSVQTVLSGRSLAGFETQHQRKDGQMVDLEIWATLVHDVDGNPGCLGIALDITERKRAEAALRESEARYQVLVSNMPGMAYRYAPTENGMAAFTYISAGSRELVELDPETILQDPTSFLRLIHPDDLASFQESVAISVANSDIWRWEGRLITPSGQLKWVQGRSRPQSTDYGKAWDGMYFDITDRKQAEEGLRQSEERLRVALKNSPITVFNQDQNLRHTWVYNPTLNLEPAEIIGKHDGDFLSEEDAAVLTQIKHRVLETGVGAREEIKISMSEQDFYYDLTVEPLLNGHGETIGITCASIDITERKQMELALRRSETSLSALIASSPIAIALCDRDLRYLHANEALANVNGIPLSAHIGHTFEEVLPEWAPVLTPILQQVMATQQPVLNYEVVGATHPSDVVRHALVNFFPVCLPDGEVLGIGVTSVDITDRRRTEEALRQSEAQYRAIYNQVIVGISQVDLTGKFLRVNERFCEITGRSPAELLNLRIQEITHPDDLPYNLVLLNRMLEDGTNFEIEKRYVRPDGSEVWVRNYVSLLRDGDGQPQASVAVTEDITEQKQAAAALSEQQHLLETILRYTANGIMVCDASGKLTFVNPEARRLAQHDPYDTALNLKLLDWGTAYDADGNLTSLENYAIARALRGEVSNVVEARMVRTDGSYYDILVSAAPLLNDGQIVGAVASFIDISDRKRVEDEREQVQHELQQTLQTLRTLIQASPLPILVIEPDLTVNLWNSAAERLFGWSEAEVLGQPLPIIPEEKQEECDQLRDAIMNGEVFFAVETYRCKRDGSHVVLSVSAAPLYNDHGNVNAILFILQDITERQLAETNLRDSEERLRLALMAANQGLYDLNIKTGDIIVTPAYAQMLGYDPDEFQETIKKWRDRFHPDDVSVAHQAYQDYLMGKTDIYQVEFRQRTRSGDWKWILSIGRIVAFDEDGQPLRMLGTHTDITDRKQAETEREQLLTREKMAREEAETANRIKDEFLAVLSHELRSPLNPILGWSKLLQTQKLDAEKTQQALATIERNAKLQTQLIEDLLDVSRILRGKLVLNITPVPLVNTIEAALETVRLAVEAKEIDLRFEGFERSGASTSETGLSTLSSLQVMGDAARLQQVVWNLLTNAVKFTPAGGQVEIRLERVETDTLGEPSPALETSETHSNYLHTLTPSSPQTSTTASSACPAAHAYAQITVRDTGKGIDPEFLPYVFDYFRQEDGTTTRKFGGLGLGLAIVRHITELHGGRVWVESQGQGLGAIFTVQLPLMSVAIAVDNSDATSTNADLDGLKVLAVDDDTDIRTLLEFILDEAGAEVRVVASALEVLQQLETFVPEVIISDVGMPDFDGYMLMRQIRTFASPRCRAIPAIALTAYAGEADQQQALAAGFQMHLAKPIEPERLIRAIVTLLNEHQEGKHSIDVENWNT